MRSTTLLYLFVGCSLLVIINWYYIFHPRILYSTGSFGLRHSDPSKRKSLCLEHLQEAFQVCGENLSVHYEENTILEEQVPLKMPKIISKKHLNLSNNLTAKKLLTIGIPSVLRTNENYLHRTLSSLISESTPKERSNVTVLVLLADKQVNIRKQRKVLLQKAFPEEIKSGFIQAIEMNPEAYPPLTGLRKTFNDSESRVQWRSKQVIDFAYLFNYSISLSEYFLILEDDVICAPKYLTAITEFLHTQKHHWVTLSYSGFLIIGRLFRTEDLKRLVPFLFLFYSEKPVDFLILQFIDLMVPEGNEMTRRVPGLFQHIGMRSSLNGKVQKLKDKSFASDKRKYEVVNPPADIMTTMEAYGWHYPELAYGNSFGYFWSRPPKMGDTFDIILNKRAHIHRIYVQTGNRMAPRDLLHHGVLEASPTFMSMLSNNRASCTNFTRLTLFYNGMADVNVDDVLGKDMLIQCIRIRVLQKQLNWLVISEIDIFT